MHFYYLAMLFVTIATPIVKMVLRALSIGLVSYVGINYLFDEAKEMVLSKMGNVGMPVQQILGLAQVDIAINIYFAAIATKLIIAGIDKVSGTKKKYEVFTA